MLCWFSGLLDALVNPMQPELYRVAKSKRTREIEILPAEIGVGRASYFPAPRNDSLTIFVFILLIVVCRPRGDYCPNGHLWDRGECLPLKHRGRGKRRAALISIRSPPGWIQSNTATIYGTSAETSAEFALSTPPEVTEVTT